MLVELTPQHSEEVGADRLTHSFSRGEHIAVPTNFASDDKIWHHGIYMGFMKGKYRVIHMISPAFLGLPVCGGRPAIEEIGLREFCKGKEDALRVIKYTNDTEECREVTVRAAVHAFAHPTDLYDLFRHNCESFAVSCRTGRSVFNTSTVCARLTEHLSCVDVTECPPAMTKFFVL